MSVSARGGGGGQEQEVEEELGPRQDYLLPPRRETDLHINPRTVVQLPEEFTDRFKCSTCHRFSSGPLLECARGKHLICSDCYTLLDRRVSCLFPIVTGNHDTDKYRCGATISESKSLNLFQPSLKFPCVSRACDAVVPWGSAWSRHMKDCSFLETLIECPDGKCETVHLPRKEWTIHCQTVHGLGISLLSLKEPVPLATLVRDNLEDVTLVALCMWNEHPIFVVAKNEDSRGVRLAAFGAHRALDWTGDYWLEIIRHAKGNKISVLLKVNPSEREWMDVKVFGRSQFLLYSQLHDKCSDDREGYSLLAKMKDLNLYIDECSCAWEPFEEPIDVSTEWEPLPPEELTPSEDPVASTENESVPLVEFPPIPNPNPLSYYGNEFL